MSDTNYDKILERIARSSGQEKEEISRRVEAKRAKLSGLISKEGAAQVIAAELGISFDDEFFKIDELLPGMRKANLSGKIIRLFPIRTFTNKKGEEGKVANLIVADDTSNVKVVLWDTNHIALIESGQIGEDSVVDIINGSVRDNEVHLGSFSELKVSSKTFDSVKTEKPVKEKTIADFNQGDSVNFRAFVVQVFDPRFFNVCPECKKKVNPDGDGFACAEHGRVIPESRALINFVLDDGTETIRAVAFHDVIPKLGLSDLQNTPLFSQQKENLLGKEFNFSGSVRLNNFFNNLELIVNDVQEINLDELLAQLG